MKQAPVIRTSLVILPLLMLPLAAALGDETPQVKAGANRTIEVVAVSPSAESPAGDGAIDVVEPGAPPTRIVAKRIVVAGAEPGDATPGLTYVGPAAEAVATPAASDDRGWLGVQLGEVPEALASQLELGTGGAMIINIAAKSPADEAGLQRWDIITAVDGERVTGGIANVVESVAAKEKDQTIQLAVVRGGQEQTVNVPLGQRPPEVAPENWKYELQPSDVFREQIRTGGRLLMRGPDGRWIAKDLGDLDALKSLPEELKDILPHGEGMTTRIFTGDDRTSIHLRVERDGETIEVDQVDGGEITVRRTVKEGDTESTTEQTYENADALQAGDEDAYEIYSGAGSEPPPGEFNINLQLQGPHGQWGWTGNVGDWHEKLNEHLDEAMKHYQDALREAEGQFHGFKLFHHRPPWHAFDDAAASPDPAPYSFRVDETGKIEVTLRKGDSEVIEVYRDESDLRSRNADLYERYQSTRTPAPEPE